MPKLTLVAMLAAVLLAIGPVRVFAGPQATAAAPSDSMENQPLRLGPSNGAAAGNDPASQGSPAPQIAMPSGGARVLAALGAVLFLILAMRWAGQRAFSPAGGRGGSSVRVISRTPVSPKQQVLLLHVGKRVLVVGDSGGRMTSLSEIADPDEVAALVGASQTGGVESSRSVFGSVFRRAKEPFVEDESAEDSEEPRASWRPGEESAEAEEETRVDGLLDKVRLMRNQFKGA